MEQTPPPISPFDLWLRRLTRLVAIAFMLIVALVLWRVSELIVSVKQSVDTIASRVDRVGQDVERATDATASMVERAKTLTAKVDELDEKVDQLRDPEAWLKRVNRLTGAVPPADFDPLTVDDKRGALAGEAVVRTFETKAGQWALGEAFQRVIARVLDAHRPAPGTTPLAPNPVATPGDAAAVPDVRASPEPEASPPPDAPPASPPDLGTLLRDLATSNITLREGEAEDAPTESAVAFSLKAYGKYRTLKRFRRSDDTILAAVCHTLGGERYYIVHANGTVESLRAYLDARLAPAE